MAVFISISIGLFIAVFSLFMIRKEVMKASFFKNVKIPDHNSEELIKHIQSLENTIEEMNQSFYDIVNDLEGKYSVHEKEIEIIDQKVNDINLLTKDLSKMLNYQGKEIASIKEPEVTSTVTVANTVSVQPSDDIKEEIIRLKALGLDEQQIARKLGKGIREINMLMNFIK